MITPSTAPIDVVVTVTLSQQVLKAFADVDPRVIVHYFPSEAGLKVPDELLKRAEVLYSSDIFPGPAQSPKLRWIQLDTSGIDHVRDSPLWKGDVIITTLGGISAAPLAEWVMMMVLAHAHHLRTTERLQSERRWPSRDERWSQLMPHNLRNSTLGIVGYGRIGHALALRAQAFGMNVIATRRGSNEDTSSRSSSTKESSQVRLIPSESLHELLSLSDYVALTVPLTSQTRGMINEQALSHARRGMVIINASRGGVVDETALLDALDQGRVALAVSDVFAQEPLPADSPWWLHPKSVVTPHAAGFAPDYEEAVISLMSENLRRYISGADLINVADRQKGY